jgi:hypothetical protein
MKRSKRKRLESIARQAGYDALPKLTAAQDRAYKIFLIAREDCARTYRVVYEEKLASLIAEAEKAEQQ